MTELSHVELFLIKWVGFRLQYDLQKREENYIKKQPGRLHR